MKALKIIAVNVAVFLALLLALEFGARLFHVVFQDGTFFRETRFITPWITSYEYPPPLINEKGEGFFRHKTTPTTVTKPPNTTRIIAVGGSTTVNNLVYESDGIHYPMLLESHLNSSSGSQSFEVLNAGADAYSTAQSLINIQFRLVEYDPDIIILMHNFNDSTVNAFKEGATADYGNKYIQTYFVNTELQGTRSFLGFLYQSRLLAKLGLPEYLAMRGDLHRDNDIDYGLHLFKRNLTHIIRICNAHDITIVLLSQPTNLESHHWIKDETFLIYNQAIAEVAEEEDVYFIDMFTELGHEQRFFLDSIHYTREGLRRFVNILYPRVLEISQK